MDPRDYPFRRVQIAISRCDSGHNTNLGLDLPQNEAFGFVHQVTQTAMRLPTRVGGLAEEKVLKIATGHQTIDVVGVRKVFFHKQENLCGLGFDFVPASWIPVDLDGWKFFRQASGAS